MRAALCINGRVITGDSHLACFEKLSTDEQNGNMDSGFYDCESGQFISENEREVFNEKQLYFVRHGQSIDPDLPDPDIAQDGEQQVHKAACCLSNQKLSNFCGFTSPLLRCLRTASILQRLLGIHFQVLPEIMETPHFLNDGEIFKVQNRSTQFPQFEWPLTKEWHVFPESSLDFYVRVKETLQQFPSHSIVVTHFGYICLTAKIALCKTILSEGIPPASVTYFHKHDGRRLGQSDAEISENRPTFEDRKAG